jgi:hypothetical protein
MARSPLFGCLLAVAVVGACDGGAEPTLEIGTGRTAFEAIGDVTGFERGFQGGLHIFGSLRATGIATGSGGAFDESHPEVTFTLVGDGGAFTGGYLSLRREMILNDDGVAELVGDRIILSTTDPTEAEDAEVILQAEVTDTSGTTVTAEATTRIAEGAF